MARRTRTSRSGLWQKIKGIDFKNRAKTSRIKSVAFIKRRPMVSFFIALGVLFLLIAGNTILTPKPKDTSPKASTKEVSIYKIGSAPKVSFSAKVDKEGVIQIVAQTPGIVSAINVFEGQEVAKGTSLISLSSNYQGGNAAGVSREIAGLQYANIRDTYETQKGAIDNQKRLAELNKNSADKMREITDQGINDTQTLINLNGDIISTLESNQQALESTNVGGVNNAMILATKQQISQFRAGIAQLQAAQRQARFAADPANPTTQIVSTSYDLTLKQLELQQKALDLSRESARLGLMLAQIAESMMYPATPFDATVEKVHVVVGQSVNPGTPLATISGTKKRAVAVATVPFDTAKKISGMEESILHLGKKKISVQPTYVSGEATNGILNSVSYTIPDNFYDKVSDGQYIKVEIPIGYPDTISTIPYIPLDIVFQTQDNAYVYIVGKNGKVESRVVALGDVVGSNVAVESGLARNDKVILDRNVIEGESIKISN